MGRDENKKFGQEGSVINVVEKQIHKWFVGAQKPFVHAFLRIAISPSEWAEKITSTSISLSGRYLQRIDEELDPPRTLLTVFEPASLSSFLR